RIRVRRKASRGITSAPFVSSSPSRLPVRPQFEIPQAKLPLPAERPNGRSRGLVATVTEEVCHEEDLVFLSRGIVGLERSVHQPTCRTRGVGDTGSGHTV